MSTYVHFHFFEGGRDFGFDDAPVPRVGEKVVVNKNEEHVVDEVRWEIVEEGAPGLPSMHFLRVHVFCAPAYRGGVG